MNAVIVVGWKSWSQTAEPTLIYCGIDGRAAEKAAASSAGFVRIGKIVNPPFTVMRVSQPESQPQPKQTTKK